MSNDEQPAHPISPGDLSGLPSAEVERPLTRRERNAVIARIQALMEYWGITAADLMADNLAAMPQPHQTPHPIKYRHPVTGDTWNGQGPHPDWLRRALLQEGLRVDELRPG